VWDSWIADDRERYHLFFLRAPSDLGGARPAAHGSAHWPATSTDLADWEVHADGPLPAAGRWDDLAHWTGSAAGGDDGVWRLYYTGLSTRPGHGVRDQRIGMAESDNPMTWRPAGDRPLVDPDPPVVPDARRGPASAARRGATRACSATPAATGGTWC
jgi:beta-fructofuranosidase